MRTAVTEARIWSMFEKEIWQSWQLPFLIVSCLLLLLLLVVGMVFLCFRQQIHKKTVERETKHVCLFPVVKPVVKDTGAVQPETNADYLSEETLEVLKSHPIRIRAKGLLERRGSNASLTIDLNPSQESLSTSTLSRDSTNEDYLLSAGNRMTRKQLRNCLKDPKTLHSEFWEIPMNHPEKVEIAGSGTKNRYRTILPNEHSRVKLEEINDDPLSAYINANYIKGYDGEEKAYIATQGPMPHTINDFWKLMWNEKACIIVMITKLREKNKVKCEPYIPDPYGKFGELDVNVLSITPRDGYVVRELCLKKGNQCHQLTHLWYTAWPDHKTPSNPKQLVAMAVEVESRRCSNNSRSKGPVVVHCSAGIGRTGCFIATSIGMQQLLEENMVDVLGIVCAMRQDRGGMVQTAEQYEFVHRTLCLFEQSLPDQPGE